MPGGPPLRPRRRDPGIGQCAGPGTGITILPSLSATKTSLELVDDPLASLVSLLITSFLIGGSVNFIGFPSGPGPPSARFLSLASSSTGWIEVIFATISLVTIIL